jgi:hypothetical protein
MPPINVDSIDVVSSVSGLPALLPHRPRSSQPPRPHALTHVDLLASSGSASPTHSAGSPMSLASTGCGQSPTAMALPPRPAFRAELVYVHAYEQHVFTKSSSCSCFSRSPPGKTFGPREYLNLHVNTLAFLSPVCLSVRGGLKDLSGLLP